jgi:hypothetical protein
VEVATVSPDPYGQSMGKNKKLFKEQVFLRAYRFVAALQTLF